MLRFHLYIHFLSFLSKIIKKIDILKKEARETDFSYVNSEPSKISGLKYEGSFQQSLHSGWHFFVPNIHYILWKLHFSG